ncbi:galectin-12 isoform X2 [Rhinolophus sinicus]|uniref:galectin-12 isoform X2 n=1 Tax=Rhinolophus sinicus TaxID=89399 RepID=UPI003D797288
MSPGEKLDPLPDTFILQPPVFHPVVPYVTTIFGGLRAGKMVMLQGVVPLKARRFQVDFQCGCSLHPRPDIAIHFNPRFYTTKPHVICNTLHNGLWQAEARWPHLALQRGASFLILFLFGNEEMKVSVNGQHFLRYRYRLPLSRVDTLGIFGDILVKAVGFLNINPFSEGSSEYPVGYPFLLKSPRLEMPCLRPLPRGLGPGQVIVLRGLVLPEPKDVQGHHVTPILHRRRQRNTKRSKLPRVTEPVGGRVGLGPGLRLLSRSQQPQFWEYLPCLYTWSGQPISPRRSPLRPQERPLKGTGCDLERGCDLPQ